MRPGTPICPRSRTSAFRTDAHAPGGVPVPGLPAGASHFLPSLPVDPRNRANPMTTLAAPRLPRPGLRRIRPVVILVVAIAIVAGSYGANALRPAPVYPPVGPAAVPEQPAPSGPGEAPTGRV